MYSILQSIVLSNGNRIYKYDVRPFFTIAVIVIEVLLLLLIMKPKVRLPFILSVAVLNYIAIYFPILYDFPAPERRQVHLQSPIFSYYTMVFKLLLCACLGYLILKQYTDNKKKLFICLLVINVLLIVAATIVETIIFGEFHPYFGFM